MSIEKDPFSREIFEKGSSVIWKGASMAAKVGASLVSIGKDADEEKLMRYKMSFYTGVPLRTPRAISVELSTACNLHCNICHQWKDNREKQALKSGDLRRIIDEIATHFPGCMLEFSGQEPTMNADLLFESLEYAQRRGVPTAMNTNGMIIDRPFAERLIRSNPQHISVSLDGTASRTHDYIRNMEGCYTKVIRAINNLVEERDAQNSDTAVAITSVICDNNLEEMPDMTTLGRELGVDSINYNAFLLDNSYFIAPEEEYEQCEFWPTDPERLDLLDQVIDELIWLKANVKPTITNDTRQLLNMPEYFRNKSNFSKGKCMAGYNYFHIHKLGDVTVCGKGPFLNVKQYPLHQIWYSYSYFKTRQKIKQCDVPCLNNCFTLL